MVISREKLLRLSFSFQFPKASSPSLQTAQNKCVLTPLPELLSLHKTLHSPDSPQLTRYIKLIASKPDP